MSDRRGNFDVVIVGAGPAGSSAAIRLARAGRKVCLLDKASFPRHKLCGEFISPECREHFAELGISQHLADFSPPKLTKTIFHSSDGHSVSIDSSWLSKSGECSLGLSRFVLDNALVERAGECGVEVRESTNVLAPIVEIGAVSGFKLRDKNGGIYEVNTKLAIDATGRGRYLSRHFDERSESIKPKQVAFKTHIRGARIEDGACELFSFRGGYGGCSGVEAGLQDVCFVVDAAQVRSIGSDPLNVFKSMCATNERASVVFRSFEVVGHWLSVPLSRYGSEDVAPFPGLLAVGDAAAFIDPFTGSGIALALQSSKIACDVIVNEDDVNEIGRVYRRSHAAAFKWRLRTCNVIRLLGRTQKLADLLIRGIGCSETARLLLARMTRSSALSETSPASR
jgi:flavin-dependent dehydrogenase